ncbi:MAG TPA: NlpC/P60 family protein [Scandinavium sp.]|uniref:C40 family peptidase n=1 Tax=Scandinavium sp. TaxID=2830653 RepID=UPI002E381572|nr:NlpC/P60 family protein [Scandinavium sp.]HEX4499863.1 NlpC/P60 family protein [Scandinavium sp.]
MAATREQIVQLARSCLGTPFRHQGRVPGRGLDCVGLVIYLSNELQLSAAHYDFTAYPRFPSQQSVQAELTEHLARVTFDDAQHGDVVLVADDGNHSCHVGILARDAEGNDRLIHAAARARAVVEQHIDRALRRKMRAIFRFRMITEQ